MVQRGGAVIDVLREMVTGVETPDVFVVSPFRLVRQRVHGMLGRGTEQMSKLSDEPRQWLWDRVGTIHTLQGKEAEAVILLLGALAPTQRSACGWAGSRPNILNVAVTRTNYAVYVVGNRELWKKHGVFQVLERRSSCSNP